METIDQDKTNLKGVGELRVRLYREGPSVKIPRPNPKAQK